MIGELDRHHGKLISISKFPEPDIFFLKKMVLSKLTLVDLATIDQDTWTKAISLVDHIDEFDAPFVALSLKMDTYLWTGDKKLITGLKDLGYNQVIDTDALMVLRNALD